MEKDVERKHEIRKRLMDCINRKFLDEIKVKSNTKIWRRWQHNDEFVIVTIKGLSKNCDRAHGLILESIRSYRNREFLKELGGHKHFACFNDAYEGAEFVLKKHGDTPKLDGFISGSPYGIHKIASPDDYKINVDEKALTTIKEGFLPALENLHKHKDEKELFADLWCHFGKAFLYNVKEEEANEYTRYTVEQMNERLKRRPRGQGRRWNVSDEGEPHSEVEESWNTGFEEGVCREKISLDDIPLDHKHTHWRYDYNFLTPLAQSVRFKAWENSDTGDVPEQVKNLSVPVNIKDQENNLVAWLCRPSSTLAKCELFVPSCSYDCRIKLRTGPRYFRSEDPKEQEEVTILAEYLSQCTFEDHHLKLPDAVPLPEGFHCSFFQEAKEDEYVFSAGDGGAGFTVLLLDENRFDSDTSEERSKKQLGIRIIMKSCAEALLSGEWEPDQIIEMLPEYMEFVGQLQELLFSKDEEDEEDGG